MNWANICYGCHICQICHIRSGQRLCCLLMNLINFAKFVVACFSGHISITSYNLHLYASFISFCLVSFAEDLINACRDVGGCLGLQGFYVVS